MLSCLFFVLFVFLADCGLQNLLALHDADVDDKACNLVECDAQPDKEYVPFQNIGHQQSQRERISQMPTKETIIGVFL